MKTLRLAVVLGSVLGFAVAALACGGEKKAPNSDETTSGRCETNRDCEAPLVCLASECADPRVHRGGTNMVTPDKMKREVEQINEQAEKRREKVLDL